jgi:transposase
VFVFWARRPFNNDYLANSGEAVTRRHDLSDAQWAVLAAVLPAVSVRGRPPKWIRRQLIDGIRWRIRVGAPWQDVPAVYAPWQTCTGSSAGGSVTARGRRYCRPRREPAQARGRRADARQPSTRSSTNSATPWSAASTSGMATRYDKLAVRYQATVTITAINEWL